jgi:hypothetical protein
MYLGTELLVVDFEKKLDKNKIFTAPLLPVININVFKFCVHLISELNLIRKARWAGVSWVQFFLFYKNYFDNNLSNVTYYLGILNDLGTILDLKSLSIYNAKSSVSYFNSLNENTENLYAPNFLQFNLNVISSYFGASLLQTAQAESFLLEIFLNNLFRLYVENNLKTILLKVIS